MYTTVYSQKQKQKKNYSILTFQERIDRLGKGYQLIMPVFANTFLIHPQGSSLGKT